MPGSTLEFIVRPPSGAHEGESRRSWLGAASWRMPAGLLDGDGYPGWNAQSSPRKLMGSGRGSAFQPMPLARLSALCMARSLATDPAPVMPARYGHSTPDRLESPPPAPSSHLIAPRHAGEKADPPMASRQSPPPQAHLRAAPWASPALVNPPEVETPGSGISTAPLVSVPKGQNPATGLLCPIVSSPARTVTSQLACNRPA